MPSDNMPLFFSLRTSGSNSVRRGRSLPGCCLEVDMPGSVRAHLPLCLLLSQVQIPGLLYLVAGLTPARLSASEK